MKFNGYIILIIFSPILLMGQQSDTIYVASWNVENLFDNIDDPDKEDSEFLSTGTKEWTDQRIYDKMSNLADVISFMNNGLGPDIIGFMEVEHQYLLEKMIVNFLSSRNYKVVGFESPDTRGIDNYIMYDADRFELTEARHIPIRFFDSDYTTRDILHGSLKFHDEVIDIFVNHWPSRRGGEENSQPRRVNAASTLKRYLDSLTTNRDESNFIIVGDFNDEPNNYSVHKILSAAKPGDSSSLLINLAWDDFERGIGTHLYNKEFNMLDQIIISNDLLNGIGIDYVNNSFEIVTDDFFIYTEGSNKGSIVPSFAAGKFINGYADHLPVAAKFYIIKEE